MINHIQRRQRSLAISLLDNRLTKFTFCIPIDDNDMFHLPNYDSPHSQVTLTYTATSSQAVHELYT